MASPARCLALLCCLVAAALSAGGAAAAPSAHERACGTAFGVLQRCAASGVAQETVRARCCGLLGIFRRNGCLCPDCPPGASAGATSPKGLLLGVELSPLMELCSPDAQPQQPPQQQQEARQQSAAEEQPAGERGGEEGYDEDSAMADMAGRAAWAEDPRSRQHPAVSAARAASVQRGPLMDTPEDDYDNQLSDGDAAFMLIDPREAARYARRAADLASRLAADLAADVAGGGAAAARIGATVQARLAQLLAGSPAAVFAAADGDVDDDGGIGGEAEREAEALASAAAMSDDDDDAGDASREAGAGRGRMAPVVRLAAAAQVPATAEQRRAAALAAAMERQQARHLARCAAQRSALPPRLVGEPQRQQERQQQQQRMKLELGQGEGEGEGQDGKRLSVDITIDADNPEAARRMAGSIAALLRTWQAASGSASSQEQLSAALEAAAAGVASAAARAGPLGRAGLQPRQLEVRQLEEGEARTCACMTADDSALQEPATDLPSALYQRYLAARLALCRFACQHEHALAVLLVGELALCVAWLAVWLLRHSARGARGGEGREGEGHEEPAAGQFLIAAAADPQWRRCGGTLGQPLLGPASRSSSLSSISSC